MFFTYNTTFLLLEKILLGRCCISLVKLIVMRKADFIWGNYFLFIIRIYGTLTKDSSDALMSKASGAKLGLMNKKRPGTLKNQDSPPIVVYRIIMLPVRDSPVNFKTGAFSTSLSKCTVLAKN